MLRYALGGTIIGGLAGGTASLVSASGGAFIAGATGGAIGNGGFAALNGSGIGNGILTGFISGGLGGYIGTGLGGGLGAITGGAVGSAANSKLNGGSWGQASIAALSGGVLAFSAYHASSFIGWKYQGGNKMGGLDISYKQYLSMQAAYQRSSFDKKEHGFWLKKDGTVTKEVVGDAYSLSLGVAPKDALAEFHTHWDKPGIDIVQDANGGPWMHKSTFQRLNQGKTNIKVIGSQTYRYHSPLDLGGGHNSFVINRFDASFYPGIGGTSSIKPLSPPVNRFIYSFLFWK